MSLSMPQWRTSPSQKSLVPTLSTTPPPPPVLPLPVLPKGPLPPSAASMTGGGCWTCGQVHRPDEPHLYDYVCEIDEDLTCLVCLQPLVQPTDTPCGHTFCHFCLLSILNEKQLCPIDRTPLKITDCRPASLMVRRLLDKLEVQCPNQGSCHINLPRCDLEEHLNSRCLGAFLPCPQFQFGCKFQGPRRLLQKHIIECSAQYNPGWACASIVEGTTTKISVRRTSGILGMSVVGGFDSPLTRLTIQDVYPDGPIASDGRLQPGDQILEINSQDLQFCNHEQSISLLCSKSDILQLTIYRERIDSQPNTNAAVVYNCTPTDEILIELDKHKGKHLGIKLLEKKNEIGVYISELIEGGIAAQDGRLLPDDKILEINKCDTRNARLDEATSLIQHASPSVQLLVSRQLPTRGSPTLFANTNSATPPLPPKSNSLSVLHSVNILNIQPPPPSSVVSYEQNDVKMRRLNRNSMERTFQPKYLTINKAVNDSLGIRIAGGLEGTNGNTPVYVQKINPDGCLGKSGLLKKGDILLNVNGTSLLGITHGEAVAALKAVACCPLINIGIIEGPETSWGPDAFIPTWSYWYRLPRCLHLVKTVVLHRNPNECLGFSIGGGSGVNTFNEAFHVLFVFQDSVAAKVGKLRCGDQILAVNKRRLDGLRHYEAVALLKQCGSKVVLDILSWPGTTV